MPTFGIKVITTLLGNPSCLSLRRMMGMLACKMQPKKTNQAPLQAPPALQAPPLPRSPSLPRKSSQSPRSNKIVMSESPDNPDNFVCGNWQRNQSFRFCSPLMRVVRGCLARNLQTDRALFELSDIARASQPFKRLLGESDKEPQLFPHFHLLSSGTPYPLVE